MGDIWSTLKSKAGPLPVWVWTLLGSIALALYLVRKKGKNGNDQAAADQTNSDLGSAAELANLFNVASLMPYQGGDVYINTTSEKNPPPSKSTPGGNPPSTQPQPTHGKPPGGSNERPPVKGAPKSRATYVVKKNDTLTSIAKHYGLSWQALYKYNTTPGVRDARTEATLKKRGPNLLFPGEKILIPPKGYK